MKILQLLILIISISSTTMAQQSIYDISINDITGQAINLNDFKGKKILFVNVASECGFTPQYEDLQKLHETYSHKLVVIGVPCNQFGKQEPGTSEGIQTFCKKNYGVTFLITEKINVKGNQQHELYQWLTQKEKNGKTTTSVKWNFQKYIVNEQGKLIEYFYSMTKPLSNKIIKLL